MFLFSKYHSISNVYVNGKLVIKENLLMQPSLINVHSIGQLEGYTHQASMLYLSEKAGIKEIQASLIELLNEEKNIESGITAAPVSGLIIRLLGNGAEQLFDCLQRINHLLQNVSIIAV
jgi:urease accessory protein